LQADRAGDEYVAAFERGCVEEFRRCGVRSDEHARELQREALLDDGTYSLRRPDHIQGCEAATTRALHNVRDDAARRLAEAHLWRFATRQDPETGHFPDERYGTGLTELGIIDMFARFDTPISRLVILRAVPWIVEAQNGDGSWGAEGRRDAETLAALRSVNTVRGDLESDFLRPG